MEKIKNFVALIPGLLFLYCGGHIYYDSTLDFLTLKNTNGEMHGGESLTAYLLSMAVEIAVVFRNMKDTQRMGGGEGQEGNIGFREIVKRIFMKKDPLLIAIIYENVITLLSTSIPILTTVLNIFYPNPFVTYLGNMFIATI
jgi:zinc transporter 9